MPKTCTFSFTEKSADILFDTKLDSMNFSELTEETVFGQIQNADKACLEALDDHEQVVSDHYFTKKNNQIVLSKPMMPAMLTLMLLMMATFMMLIMEATTLMILLATMTLLAMAMMIAAMAKMMMTLMARAMMMTLR